MRKKLKLAGLILLVIAFIVAPDNLKNTSKVIAYGASLSDYDFDDDGLRIDDENFQLDFAEIVNSVYSNKFEEENVFGRVTNIFFGEIRNSLKLIALALGVIVAGAVFKNITEMLNDMSVSKTGAFITYNAAMVILFVAFEESHSLAAETTGKIMDFLYSLVPTFFCAVTFTNGSLSSAVLYQWTGMCLGIINITVVKFLMPLAGYFVVISIINNCTADRKFENMCSLLLKIIKYVNRLMLTVIVGMTSIKSMTVPLTGTLRNTLIKNSISFIPGIGTGVENVAETVAGTGNLIKNSIGVAGLICVVVIMITPIIKLTIMNILMHFLAAITEPVAMKNITAGIKAITDGLGILQQILCTSSFVLMITIGIICMSTGG